MVAMLRYENVWLQRQRFQDAERVFYENEFSDSRAAASVRVTVRNEAPVGKMAATLRYENVWLQRQRFEDAERVFYENSASRPSAVVQANVRIEAPAAVVSNACNAANESSPLKNIEDQIANFKEIILDLQSKINAVGARVKKMEDRLGAGATPAQTKPVQVASKEEDDDDVDLFGSDSEEDDAASEAREKLLEAYAAKKAKKPVLIAKSNIILDIKPWDDETDMKQMEAEVRKIAIEGLLWGAAKLVPLAFGIHKLQISCVVEDELVSVDLLQEQIEALEDFVQSVDIAAFNKV